MNAVIISALLISAVLIFIVPRRYVPIVILASALLLPMGPRINILGFGFTAIRFILLFGWLRLIIKSEYRSIKKFNTIDKTLFIFVITTIVTYTLVYQTIGAFIYRINVAYYVFGTFFLFRFYIIDLDDIERIIKYLLYIVIVIAFFVVIERLSYANYFSIFGGVSPYTIMREGKLRCLGPFSHPITLGSFGAFLMPLAFYMLWKKKGSIKLGLVSLIASIAIVVFSSSSGPFISLVASVIGLFMWPFRKHMRIVRWGLLSSLIGLHIVMKAPVWALIQRVGVFAGSNTYHRYLLVDEFIKTFSDWWLIGVKVVISEGDDIQLWDTSNNYVLLGKDGGLASLLLFLIIVALCFRHIGRMLSLASGNVDHQKMFWIMGVGMFSYLISFFGVSLWDQTIVIWYLVIAMITGLQYKSTRLPDQAKEEVPAAI
ncbi:MAG: hypothetical protein CVU51_01325 [Deltaproteobacteria bacterium HGW-Deltaproteobacteria-1]|nr:MAG: hypothetical protein CVU51_01325 [Deltaproteobacteria bacterium HGW-Deltaproteobacteria-1]